MKKAIVFGATGQVGSYLVELLIAKDYHVLPYSSNDLDFCSDEYYWHMEEAAIIRWAPDEIYNFAGKQFAPDSWLHPKKYIQVNAIAVSNILELLLEHLPKTKVFNAGSADMFDKSTTSQSEDTAKKPDNPYGLSKLFAYEAVRIYRERGLFACTGIFFNMESPRRKKTFFAEKVVSEAVRIKRELDSTGKFKPMQLGRLDAYRDWGWAPEYVEVAWRMLQQEQAEDFVIGTGETHSCKEYVYEALGAAGLDYFAGYEPRFVNLDHYVKYEPGWAPDSKMHAVPMKAKKKLGWEAKYKMKDVIRMLVKAEQEEQIGKSLAAR